MMDLMSYLQGALNINNRRLSEDVTADSSSALPSWAQFLVVMFLCVSLYFFMRGLFYVAYYWQRKAEMRMEEALKLRASVRDKFRDENGYSWDFVFVFKVTQWTTEPESEMKREFSFRNIVLKLADAGLQTKVFYSAQNDEVYCKVRAPVNRLNVAAKDVGFKLICDPINVANLLQIGNHTGPAEKHWGPISIHTDGVQTEIPPYDFIYATYNKSFNTDEKMLYQKYSAKSVYRGVDRVKLIQSIITNNPSRGGAGLNIYELQKDGCILGFYPIHDEVELSKLEAKWFIFWQWPSNTPVTLIKEYFGEKIGFMQAFLAHYTGWMIFPAFCGFCTWINVAAKNDDPNVILAPIYAFGMAIWATLFLESWKRREGRLAMEWGVFGDAKVETVRPEYVDNAYVKTIPSPIHGEPMLYFPRSEFMKRQVISTVSSIFFVLCVLALFVGMFAVDNIMSGDPKTTDWSSTIAASINATIVIVMGAIYAKVVDVLNEYENHRTMTEFEDALIIKTFVVQFINSFTSLFFIAFGQNFLASMHGTGVQRCTGSCMKMLQSTLSVLFLSNLAIGCSTALVVPYLTQYMRAKDEFTDVDEENISRLEREFLREEYELTKGPFQDYANYTLQFAYATMFISAYPLATCMALVNNYVMMRVNTWFFCHMAKRPVPFAVNDIGTWFSILELISYMAVLVSAGLVAFTGTIAQNNIWSTRIWLFILMSAAIIFVKYIVQVSYPRVNEEVDIQLARNKYILQKIFDNVPDDDDRRLMADVAMMSKVKLDIRITDDDPC